MEVTNRDAVADDLAAINDIYNAYIVGSHVSFDMEPWDMANRSRWWDRYGSRWPISGSRGRGRGCRRGSGVQRSVPAQGRLRHFGRDDGGAAPTSVGRGVGRRLFGALLAELQAAGVHRAYSIVALPNDASVALHRRLGYRTVGVCEEVGFKLGRYWSTMLLEKRFDD